MLNTLDEKIKELYKTANTFVLEDFADDAKSLILSEAHRIGEEAIGDGQQLLIQINDTEHANGAYASVHEQRQRLSKITGGKE